MNSNEKIIKLAKKYSYFDGISEYIFDTDGILGFFNEINNNLKKEIKKEIQDKFESNLRILRSNIVSCASKKEEQFADEISIMIDSYFKREGL